MSSNASNWADAQGSPQLPAAAVPEGRFPEAPLGGRERRSSERAEPPVLPDQPPFEAFVGSLAYEVEEADLLGLFSPTCTVVTTRLIRDRDTGRPKGYAYVEFADRDSLARAFELNGTKLMDREVRVDVAQNRRDGGRRGGAGGHGHGHERSHEHEDASVYGSKGYRPVQAESFDYEKEPDAESLKRRPKLKLLPRGSKAPAAAPPASAPKKKGGGSNPFGAARPREEILAERRHVDQSVIVREEAEKEEFHSVGAVQAREAAAAAAAAPAPAAVPVEAAPAARREREPRRARRDEDGAAAAETTPDGFSSAAAGRGRRQRRTSERSARARARAAEEGPADVEAENPFDLLEDSD